MFDAIKNFVADLASGDKQPGGFGDQDFASGDGRAAGPCRGDRRRHVRCRARQAARLLKQRFELDDAAADELIEQAAAADEKAVDLYHFTHLLNGSLDDSERLRMIEMMWEIAYADGAVSEFEDNLIWRVADLLGVSSSERIALRHRVAGARGRRRMTPVDAHHRRVGRHRRRAGARVCPARP